MNLPSEMRAVDISEPGGPNVLVPVSRPLPEPRDGEVLIRVVAAGVNRPDCLQRSGLYPVPPDADPLPGLEVAGEIVALGRGAKRYSPGDRVCALVHGGGYAEYCRAHETHCLPIPDDLTVSEAAALPETLFTVYYNLVTRCSLARGDVLLVHGGSSGIGSAATQMAKAFGATVITTAGSEKKCEFCRQQGADLAINYREQDFSEAIREYCDGIDVVLDMVGGDYIEKNLALLKLGGRYCFIAFLGGATAKINFVPVLRNRLTITGSTLRPQSVSEKATIAADLEANVWPLIAAGKIKPAIHSVFPLGEAARAHALMESSEHMGKIVLNIAKEASRSA